VLEATNKFQTHPDTKTLVNLLEAVRDSLGYQEYLPSTDSLRDRNKYDPGILFPPRGSTTEFSEDERRRVLIAEKKAELAQLEAREPDTGQNEEVVNKGDSEESETGNRGHTKSLIDAQPGSSLQVDASSEDTTMREPPVNGANPDMGSEETKDESPSHPRWQFWKR
jgi:hypothetical protein